MKEPKNSLYIVNSKYKVRNYDQDNISVYKKGRYYFKVM